MNKCWDCRKEITKKEFRCDDCISKLKAGKISYDPLLGSWSRRAHVERTTYAEDLLQPFKGDKINKDFVKVNGTSAYQEHFGMSDLQVRKTLERQ